MADDLTTREGIESFVASQLEELVNQMLGQHHEVKPFGVVIAGRTGAHEPPLDAPEAIPLSSGDSDEVACRGTLRKAVRALAAHGVIFVRQNQRTVIAQMEHAQLGDLAWIGTVAKGQVSFGPARLPERCVPALEKTRLMPARYLN